MTASSPPPAMATKSTCTAEKVQGFHRFEIRNYSVIKGLATTAGDSVTSATFPVGGYDWRVLFYPSGCLRLPAKGDTSVYIQLMTSGATVRATFLVRAVNPASGQSLVKGHTGIGRYSNGETSTDAKNKNGFRLMAATELEASYVDRDSDRLILDCTLTVIGEPRASATSDLLPAPAHLLKPQDPAADMRGQRLTARRLVLAMRSPEFKAELFGPMSEGRRITIQGVDAAAFKALLDIIYTDSYPAMDDVDEDVNRELAQHLLVAADRYGMDRLKAQCEEVLSTSLNERTVASTLALADRHGCHQLKEACVEFMITSGMNNGSVAISKEDGRHDQLNCCSFLKYFCEAVGSILKIH